MPLYFNINGLKPNGFSPKHHSVSRRRSVLSLSGGPTLVKQLAQVRNHHLLLRKHHLLHRSTSPVQQRGCLLERRQASARHSVLWSTRGACARVERTGVTRRVNLTTGAMGRRPVPVAVLTGGRTVFCVVFIRLCFVDAALRRNGDAVMVLE